MPIGTPVIAGTLASAANQAAYIVPVTVPVPPGTPVAVFAGANGAFAGAPTVRDSQGNTYTAAGSSTVNETLQAFTATAAAGLNPLNGDTWTVTYATAGTQQKTIIAVMVPGAAATDIAVAADSSSTAPSVSGTATSGNEIALACIVNGNAGGSPSAFSFTALGSLAPSGQQVMTVGFQPVTRAIGVTASATITSAPWAAVLVSLTAAPPAALGPAASPGGGAQLPPFPVLPAPQTWVPESPLTTAVLRADPGNALLLLANPPLAITGQTTTTQAIPKSTVTTLALDNDLTDTWGAHTIPDRTVVPPLSGWYLCEGYVFLNDTSTTSTAAAGIQSVAGGTTVSTDGGRVSGNGVNFPIPNVADLVQVSAATGDTIALYCWQDGSLSAPVASAWLKTEWVAAPSGTVVTGPVAASGFTSGATTLLAGVGSGTSAILLTDPTGVRVGALIGIDTGSVVAETVTVTSVAGQTIGVSGCAYAHPAGAPVAVPVSSAFMNEQIRDKIRFLSYRPIARLTSSGITQSLPSQAFAGGTAVRWASPATSGARDVDNFSGWSAANPTRYTFPKSGTWYVYGQVYVADASAKTAVSAGIGISGGTIWWGDRVFSAGSTSEFVCATVKRASVRVTAGQWAEIFGNQDSGGSLAAQTGTGNRICKLLAVWRGF